MKVFFQNIIEKVLDFREFAGDVLIPAMPFLIVFSIVISALLVWIIVYTTIRSGFLRTQLEVWSDITMIGNVSKRRKLRIWKRIVQRTKTEDMADWKKAILEADAVFDEILKVSGYRGENIHDRFKQLPPEAISNHEKIIAAHEVRDKIMQDPEYIISREEMINVLREYQKAFRELGLID